MKNVQNSDKGVLTISEILMNDYKILGEDFLVYDILSPTSLKRISSLSNDEIIFKLNNVINKLEKNDILYNTWVFIYTDILIKRRINKINKIKERLYGSWL